MGRVNKKSGFTIVELVVTMAVSAIIVTSIVGAVAFFITNTAMTNTRNRVHTDLQASFQKIASYVRSSDNVLLYNWGPDDNAPTVKIDAADATKVPGPDSVPADDNYKYYWRSTDKQLVMAQPSRDASGKPIYTNPANNDYSGPRDSTVLYLKNGALYERNVYTSQSANTTLTCAGTSTIGGCPSDIKVVDNVKNFAVTYYNSTGVEIPSSLPDGSGGTINNYNARKLAKAVKIDLTLETIVNDRKVTVSDVSTVSFRTGYIAGSTVIGSNNGSGVGTGAEAPPWSLAGNMYFGPGGLVLSSIASMTGPGVNIIGKLATNNLSGLNAGKITVGNKACGSVPTWPTVCPTEPISGTVPWGWPTIVGDICATGQTTTTNMQTVRPNCVAPPITMPMYDRQTFIDSMKTQQPANNGSCSLTNFTAKTLGPDIMYNGSLTNDYFFCKMKIKGNIYVKGDFLSNTALTLAVDESVGLKRPVVVVDGNISMGILNQITLNSYGTGIDFISFGSANANCLTIPTCSDRSDPAYLYNSYNKPTIILGGLLQAQGSSYYSYYGSISMGLSALTGNVSGQTVVIDGGRVVGS
jgi:prepilin-type N-terminal cleavage/methylation domain-containing protein